MKFFRLFLCGLLSFMMIYGIPLAGLDQYPTSQEGAFYNHHSQQQWKVAYEALKLATFKGNERVLDIGCGPGKITANIAGRISHGSILGLDFSQGMITYAQKNYAPFYNNLFFTRGDILDVALAPEFDLIFSSSSLHWILDHESLLAHIYDALKHQGSIIFTIPCTSLSEVSAVFNDVTSQEPWKSYLRSYHHPRRKFTPEEYILQLQQAGFKDIEVTQTPFTYFFETKREFADWFSAFSPMLGYIPPTMHEQFLTAITERYLRAFPLEDDGQIIFQQNELIVKARKY